MIALAACTAVDSKNNSQQAKIQFAKFKILITDCFQNLTCIFKTETGGRI